MTDAAAKTTVETTEELQEKLAGKNGLLIRAGHQQFMKAFAEADLLQMNQEILRIKNELAKRESEPTKAQTSPSDTSEIVPTPETHINPPTETSTES